MKKINVNESMININYNDWNRINLNNELDKIKPNPRKNEYFLNKIYL